MRVIAKGRRHGKTTELIRMAAESGAYIVTTTHRDAIRIVREAEGLGLYINFPLTVEEFRSGQYVAAARRIPGLLFDNADMVLQAMSSAPVLAMSVTVDAPDADGAGDGEVSDG